VIVITATVGGAAGFTVSWLSTGVRLLVPQLLISILLMRSVGQQIVNQRDYSKFKKLVNQILEDDKRKQTLRALFTDGEIPTTNRIEIKPWDSDKNTLPEFNFDSDQTFEEFIKARMKDELGLVDNLTPEQLEEIIHTRKIKMKPKAKTVHFKDFIEEIGKDPGDIIDAEIVKEAIK